jgi:hypothetical protein
MYKFAGDLENWKGGDRITLRARLGFYGIGGLVSDVLIVSEVLLFWRVVQFSQFVILNAS